MTWDEVYPKILQGRLFRLKIVDDYFNESIRFGIKGHPFIYREYLLRDDWEEIDA